MKSLPGRLLFSVILGLFALQAFPQLIAGGDTTICQGGQAQLTATGGGASYYWSSEPFDPSLLIPQQQNPIVSPQVTTMYVVQSNIATGNLILNGSFELGVVGFSSDYINNQTSIVAEGTYAVVNDAHTVHPNFFCNQDHTSGSGKFMAVNGSGVPNVRVWHLSLPQIEPHHQYEFSTWITSLHPTNPAVLQFSINGQLMAEPFQAYSSTCDWYQFFYIWESDTNTTANISIVNQNTILSGNDFALDDISFATVLVYYDTVWVTVMPQFNSPFTAPAEACAQETITVEYTGNAPDTAEYHWDFGGAEVISGSGQGPYQVRYEFPGQHAISLYVTGEGCPSDTTEKSITVGESPLVGLTADATWIPYGTSTTLHGDWSGGQGPFTYYWEPEGLLIDPMTLDPHTVDLINTEEFTLYVTDETGQCTGFGSITIQVTGGPLGVVVQASPEEVCPDESTELTAVTSGGTGIYTYLWESYPPGFTSDLPSPTVIPGQTTEYFVVVDDGLGVAEGSIIVTVNEQPLANAGTDQFVPYGTSTVLEGTASGGSGEYLWHWMPEDLLIDPFVQHPQTVNITVPVMLTLIVEDSQSGCESAPDHMTVTPEGGPLSGMIQVEDSEICKGDTIELAAIASGGNQGNYSYSWTDNFGTTYPSTPTIAVHPAQTTTYYLTVFDQYNYSGDDFTLTVFPAAEFILADGQGVIHACPYDTVLLAPSPNPGQWSYLWSNGSVEDTLMVGSTGIGYDIKTFSLLVETENGCTNEQEVTIVFDFSYCFGVGDDFRHNTHIYPNPGKGIFTLETLSGEGWDMIEIYNAQSELVHRRRLDGLFLNGRIIMDLSFLSPGLYLVLFSGRGGQAIEKMVILP